MTQQMKLWKVGWGYGDLVTMAETKEVAREKFLQYDTRLSQELRDGKWRWIPIDHLAEVTASVEYFGE